MRACRRRRQRLCSPTSPTSLPNYNKDELFGGVEDDYPTDGDDDSSFE